MSETNRSEDLTPEEQSLFRRLKRKTFPPAALEEKTVHTLKRRGLLATTSFLAWPGLRLAAAMVSMIIIFSLGFSLGRKPGQSESLTSAKSVFVLFFHDTEDVTMDDRTRAVVYANWVREVRASGRFAVGSRLRNSGRILRLADNRLNAIDVSMDQQMSNLRGYALIEAEDIDEAIRIASTNPHLEHHGILAVRQLEYVVE